MGREKNKSAFAYVKKFGEEEGKRHFFQFVLELLPPQKKADVFGYTEL